MKEIKKFDVFKMKMIIDCKKMKKIRFFIEKDNYPKSSKGNLEKTAKYYKAYKVFNVSLKKKMIRRVFYYSMSWKM